jgi:hypothetical protein
LFLEVNIIIYQSLPTTQVIKSGTGYVFTYLSDIDEYPHQRKRLNLLSKGKKWEIIKKIGENVS